jgi:hypothetical protein
VGRRGEPLGRGVGDQAGGGEGGGGQLPAGQGLLPSALQLQRRGQAAVGAGEAGQVAGAPAPVGDLAPGGDGLAEVASELVQTGEALEHVEAGALVALVRPQRQCPAGGPGRVAVGVHGGERLRRRQQRRPGLVGSPPERPVVGHHHRGGVGGLQPLGHGPVQRPPPRPGNL